MGILDKAKNAIGCGISQGVSKGISAGLNKAVGEAVNKVAAPAVNKWAERTVGSLNESFSEIRQGISEANDAASSLTQEQRSAAAASFAGLNLSGLEQLRTNAEQYATELAKGFKECPVCGETCTSDKIFCPSCGARLPETTVAEAYVCTKCGKQNSVDTKFCQVCGEVLPVYRAEYEAEMAEREAERARQAAEEQEAQRRREAAAAAAADRGFGLNDLKAGLRGGIGSLRSKAEDIGGDAAEKAFDAAANLLGRFKK